MLRRFFQSMMGLLALAVLMPGARADKPNVLLICVDDLRPELGCYGVDYIHSPNIDGLAAGGRVFQRHYVQAPTCGASRYTLLTGKYGGDNNMALFARSEMMTGPKMAFPPTMPAWFKHNGYTTVSVGKVSHHPGGLGGSDWNDPAVVEMPDSWNRSLLPAGLWQHPRGWMHGLANGEIRRNAKQMDVFQALDGPDSIYPDGPSVEVMLEQLDELAAAGAEKPFFMACGILRPHLPFGAPAKYLELYAETELPTIAHPQKPEGSTTWHGSGEFMKYNRWNRNPNDDAEFAEQVRKHYAACVSYADAQVGKLLERLDELKLRKNTIVVLWGDHGWHLGEHSVWGKHTLFEESLRSPLIVSYAGIPEPGAATEGIVETLDIFPTLVDLAGLPEADFVTGRSLRSQLEDPAEEGRPAFAYKGGLRTVRTDTFRLIAGKKDHVELYDHGSPDGETRNLATEQPEKVAELSKLIDERFGGGE